MVHLKKQNGCFNFELLIPSRNSTKGGIFLHYCYRHKEKTLYSCWKIWKKKKLNSKCPGMKKCVHPWYKHHNSTNFTFRTASHKTCRSSTKHWNIVVNIDKSSLEFETFENVLNSFQSEFLIHMFQGSIQNSKLIYSRSIHL